MQDNPGVLLDVDSSPAASVIQGVPLPVSAIDETSFLEISQMVGPALMILLWDSSAPCGLKLVNDTLILLWSGRATIPQTALELAADVVQGVVEDRQPHRRAVLPRFDIPGVAACAATGRVLFNSSAAMTSGRATRFRTTAPSRRLFMSAQQSLNLLVLVTEKSGEPRLDVRQHVASELLLPIDQAMVGRRPPLLVPGPSARRRGRPLVLVVSPAPFPPAGGTLELGPVIADLERNPAILGGAQLRIARALARGPADVFLVPWYSLRCTERELWCHGVAVRVLPDGQCQPELVGPQRPDAMVMYPVSGHGEIGESSIETEAAGALRQAGIVRNTTSRTGVVANLMHAGARRGIVTNVSGTEGALWRKDRLEEALRWWNRHSGRPVARPTTYVCPADQVPMALDAFARRGWPAVVKPATGARAEGLHLLAVGESDRQRWPRGSYVVQRLVGDPYLIDGHKVDLRCYVLIDSDRRSGSRRLPLILLRKAPEPWSPGSEIGEITNSSFKSRLGLPPRIFRLDEMPMIPSERNHIESVVDDMVGTVLDAAFAWRSAPRGGAPHTRRVLIWGLDIMLAKGPGGPRALLLEINVYPQFYRGDRACDAAVDEMLRTEFLPALTTRRAKAPALIGAASPKIALLTSRNSSTTARALARACDRLGAELVVGPDLPDRVHVAFRWGLDKPTTALRTIRQTCAERGIPMINGRNLDKYEQIQLMSNDGIPIPRSFLARGLFQAGLAASELGFPVVLKPLNGSYSRGVQILESMDELLESWPGRPRLVQEFLTTGHRCARLLTVGGAVTSAVLRVAHDGRLATYDHGRRATLETLSLEPDTERIAAQACAALDVQVGGVDLVFGDNGPVVLEVNHRGVEFDLAELHGPDGVAQVARYLVERASAR